MNSHKKAQNSCASLWPFFPASVRELVRNELGRKALTANSDDNVLLAVQHVGHGCARLACRHVHFALIFACRLVVCAQHGADFSVRCCECAALTGDHQSFRYKHAEDAGPSCSRKGFAFECRMILDVVRSFAVRNLPHDVAFVEIDRRDTRVWRFHERQSLYSETRTPALATTAAPARRPRAGVGISRLTLDPGEVAGSIRITGNKTQHSY